jgi:CubicO group peptidase (beta-lactamase class C family)
VLNTAEPVAKQPEERIGQLVKAALGGDQESPGVSIAVQQDGKVIYSKGFGYANLEYDIKNTPTTIFHIASVSKQFTAFAIAMLADQGKLSINDDIRKYLPELHDFGSVITINHLIHHTSGLRDQWSLLTMAGWRMDDVITQKQIMRVISRQTDLNFKPGEEMLYCNTGFTLLAEIVSRVTGQHFEEWTKKNIFEPLQMKNTFFYVDHQMIVKNRAYSYYKGPDGFKKLVLSYANAGATSLFTTVEDLSLWAINFEKMKVGNPKIMAMMKQRFVLNNGDTITYAFGQETDNYKGLHGFSHGGADAGYRTYLLRFPDQHFSVAVISNLSSFNPGELSYQIADLYLAKNFVEQKPAAQRAQTPQVTKKELPFDPKSVKLNEFTGKFYSPELLTSYTLVVVRDTLTARHQRNDDIKLIPVKADGFESNSALGRIEFIRDKKGGINQLKMSDGRVRNLIFDKEP